MNKIQQRLNDIPAGYRKIYERSTEGKASPREAIKSFCLECICWQKKEISLCPSQACPLHMYRPYQKGCKVADSATLATTSQPKATKGHIDTGNAVTAKQNDKLIDSAT